MILFVFEGGKAEPTVFDSIGKLFLSNEELCVVKCRHDLPTLYSNLRANGYDLFRSLPFEDNGVILPKDKRLDTLFSLNLYIANDFTLFCGQIIQIEQQSIDIFRLFNCII